MSSISQIQNPSSLQQYYNSPVNNQQSYQEIFKEAKQSDISITTKDGDTVTIKQSSYEQQQLSMMKDAYSSSLNFEAVSGNSFSLEVKGDLSEKEIDDLNNLLNDLTEIAADFFSGDMEDAFAGAIGLSDMGSSLSSMEASFSQTTLFSSLSQSSHPMPSPESGFNDQLKHFADDYELDDLNNIMADQIKAQWEQFLSQLDSEDDKNPPRPENSHRKELDDTNQSPGKSMFARAKEALEDNPRLTPLIPSLSDLAIDRASILAGADFSQKSNIAEDFLKQFQGWMI